MPRGSRNSVSRISLGVIGSWAFAGVAMIVSLLMSVVVGDLDVGRAGVGPDEADPALVVDADGVLAGAVADQPLQSVAGWHPQAVQWA